MADSLKNTAMTLSEAFDLLDVSNDEVELSRTNDLWDIDDPNWNSSIKNFELGLQNSEATTIGKTVAKKIKPIINTSVLLSDLLQVITQGHMAILKLVEKLFGLNKEVKKNA